MNTRLVDIVSRKAALGWMAADDRARLAARAARARYSGDGGN